MLQTLGLVLLLLQLPGLQSDEQFDLIIRGGKVVDGSGNPWVSADVGIRGDRIARVGDLSAAIAVRTINAEGLVVAPGFIDPHTHAVRGIFDVPTADNALLQGVTTLIEGNDGSSPYPIAEGLQRIAETKISPNWALFVGQGTVRTAVVGLENRVATEAEREQMKQMVGRAMEEGALGLSTGLFYVPGNFTPTEEIIDLAVVAASFGGIYISHMRDEAKGLLDSVRETIRIGEEARIPSQITHHKAAGSVAWGKSRESLALVDAARGRGVDITIDQYPYTASQTSINALMDQIDQEGGREAILGRLKDPEARRKIKEGVKRNILYNRGGGDPKNVFIAVCEWDRSLQGKNLAEIAAARGLEPNLENGAEVVLEIVEKGGARAVYHAIAEEDVERILKHPATAIGSDGGISVFGVGVPHPREYGTFARVLGRYVREKKIVGLEDAVRKMSSATAQRLGFRDRGLLREGYMADIAVFSAEKIQDNATFENPHQFASGVQYVLVNGEVVVEDGKHTGARPGRVLYGPGKK